MQLSKIKMSGFKSFVDPTTINLPSKLIAIVGPNGCGKSNIIDAVTWVMGENSPKYLRGEALTDVIFNGSNTRKPVGQASVELIFDNTDGTIGGEFAKFSELSIKRMINRESDACYYLNGVRCRKRDITDIFLGTGLGPRSYSIIGQNMISRVIEAKPDDLRTYLEEAAGISKYKERRHETELRIQHTKENLARINDLRAELEKQLSHLKHQANMAEKFKSLKQQERVTQAELFVIQWRQLDSRIVDFTLKIQREETALEARQSELTGTDREIEQLRLEQRAANDAFQEVQRHYYAIGNDITRVEQDILHHQERENQLTQDFKTAEDEWQSISDQQAETEDNLQEFKNELNALEPTFSAAEKEAKHSHDELMKLEDAMQHWQTSWDEFNINAAKTAQTIQVEKTNIKHHEQQAVLLNKRQDELQVEQSKFNFVELNKEIEDISRTVYSIADKLELENKQLENIRQEIIMTQDAQQDSTLHLNNVRSELQRLCGQQASLEALQQTALGQRDNSTIPWLAKHHLTTKPRLAQHIEVSDGFEFAVEKVLGSYLQAICVESIDEFIDYVDQIKSGNVSIYRMTESAPQEINSKKDNLLLNKIKSPWPLDSLLAGIYVADSIGDALNLCQSLNQNESVITRDGVWVNRSWLKVLREENPAAGVFQREQELKQLGSRIEHLQQTQKELEIHIKQRHEKLRELEVLRDQLQQSVSKQQAEAAHYNAQGKMKQDFLAELKLRAERFITEQANCVQQLQQVQSKLTQSQALYNDAENNYNEQNNKRNELLQERDKLRHELQQMRENTNKKKDHMHELAIRLQTTKSQEASLQQLLGRLQTQLKTLNERKLSLQNELSNLSSIDSLKKSLSQALDKHVTIEGELNRARVAIEALDLENRNLEERRQTIEKDINKTRTVLEALRVDWQGWKVKAESIHEQIQATEFTLEEVLKELNPEATQEEWQTKLDQIQHRINRLGAINLIAIEEYATCHERKEYLDNQLADLQAGLQTLDDAMSKIDRETKTRFKETFDKVNARFQELFPTIFGGGKAYIELTSDDLLETGVAIMACPPGKRNSSIYLLSGGEKTLTAIALIFSIFNLNPAPFCLLDEVDAALDDANVLKFGHLLKEMANKTQFIFISHNKLTIELAEHLIGVTMNEPGVSRLVSVDIEQAISLAGT